MRRWLAAVPLVSLLSVASCSFLLDFDELSAGDDAGSDAAGGSSGSGGSGGASGTSGASGSGGGSGSSGNDGGGQCVENCADTDPCTEDRCDTTAAPARCVHEPTTGVVSDGFSATLSADEMHRVTMTSGNGAFYYSVFERTNAAPEVTLYRLGSDATSAEELAKVSSIIFLGNAQSAGGLLVDLSQGFRLHAFAALGNAVYHLVFDSTFQLTTASPAQLTTTFDHSNPRRYPVAMKLASGEIAGAWINTDGTVSIGSATRLPATPLTGTARVAQITPIASANTPGVLWTGTAPNVVNLQLAGGTPTPVTQCNTQAGAFTSATSAEVVPGFWIASWTKAGVGYLVTEGKGLGCADVMCGAEAGCGAEQATAGLRNPAVATATRPGDPPGTVLLASAAPFVGPTEDGTGLTSAIALIVQRLVLDTTGQTLSSDPIGTVELAQMPPVGALQEGPDFPAVSILPPNKIAVAWIQPATSGSGDEMRLERYRICMP